MGGVGQVGSGGGKPASQVDGVFVNVDHQDNGIT